MTQSSSGVPSQVAVYEHSKRREWGLGVLAWETRDKRGYVFENGQLRVLVEPFYPLMRQVERPIDEVRALLDCLKPEIEAARAEQGQTANPDRKPPARIITFEEQVAAFRVAFPEGFQSEAWQQKQRGTNAKKRLSAHRDPAIAEAAEKLGAQVFEAKIAEQAFRSIYEDITSLLRRTDLVPAAELAVLAGAEPERQRALALMVMELLHGNGGFGPRYDRFLTTFQQAFGKPAGWQLATALPALLEPGAHVPVRPATFRTQSKALDSVFSIPKSPTASSYLRCVAIARRVSEKLVEKGEKPRDLLDIYDFMCATAKASAKRK